MLVIRTAEEMAHALSSPLDPLLLDRLAAHRNQLLDYPDYPFEELGVFIIVQPGNTLDSINAATSVRLIEHGAFTFEAEAIDLYDCWLELLFILSDDGFGVVLFVPLEATIDPQLLHACQALTPNLQLPADHKD